MISRRTIVKTGLVLSTATMCPNFAWAHRQKYTLSQVTWDNDTSFLSVTHSFHLHDAEIALAAAGLIEKPDLLSLKARARLALYTAKHFKLFSSSEPIALKLIGAEAEGRHVYVYQQAQLKEKPTNLSIQCELLRDIVEGQINNVDVDLSGIVKSVKFTGDDGIKNVLA